MSDVKVIYKRGTKCESCFSWFKKRSETWSTHLIVYMYLNRVCLLFLCPEFPQTSATGSSRGAWWKHWLKRTPGAASRSITGTWVGLTHRHIACGNQTACDMKAKRAVSWCKYTKHTVPHAWKHRVSLVPCINACVRHINERWLLFSWNNRIKST